MSNPAENRQGSLDAQERWAVIRSLTVRLSRHARNREWKAVGEIHTLREELIRNFFDDPDAVSKATDVRNGILKLLESDEEIIALMRQERSNAASELQRLQSGRAANKAYTDVRGVHGK